MALKFYWNSNPSTFKTCDTLYNIYPDSINRHAYWYSGSVVEHPLCDREVVGSIPGRVIPKTLKMVLAALSLGAHH